MAGRRAVPELPHRVRRLLRLRLSPQLRRLGDGVVGDAERAAAVADLGARARPVPSASRTLSTRWRTRSSTWWRRSTPARSRSRARRRTSSGSSVTWADCVPSSCGRSGPSKAAVAPIRFPERAACYSQSHGALFVDEMAPAVLAGGCALSDELDHLSGCKRRIEDKELGRGIGDIGSSQGVPESLSLAPPGT